MGKTKKRKQVLFMHSQDTIKQGEMLNQVTIMITQLIHYLKEFNVMASSLKHYEV